MIHSLAGGKIRDIEILDLVQVRLLEGEEGGTLVWCKMPFFIIKVGDICLVSQKNKCIKAKVEKIDKNVKQSTFPLKFKFLQEIIKKL